MKEQVEHISVIVPKCVMEMAATHWEHRLLFMVCEGLVLSVTECALAVLALSRTQMGGFGRIQNESI